MAPRVMNCGHTYCGSCIEIFAEQKDGMVICPFCTRTHFCNTSKSASVIIFQNFQIFSTPTALLFRKSPAHYSMFLADHSKPVEMPDLSQEIQ